MAETTQSSGRSSLLYAMGKLAAETAANSQELIRVRDAYDTLPDKVATAIQPRLLLMETALTGHDRRLKVLERNQWLWIGGGSVVVAAVPILIKFLPQFH